MAINELVRDVQAARQLICDIAGADMKRGVRAKVLEAERKLGAVLLSLGEIKNDLFDLQEQNQQLRRDLSDHVCPRICGHRRACAS